MGKKMTQSPLRGLFRAAAAHCGSKEKFQKEFPNEPKYHHCLKEESEALHTMVSVISEQKKADSVLDPALATLIEDR
jgi:hypothetical protein